MKRIILILIFAVLSYSVWYISNRNSSTVPADTSVQSPFPSLVGRKIIGYDGVDGKTALELLKSSYPVVTKSSAYGEYVDSIDGIQGGTEGRYWIVYVDGQMATVGAGQLVTNSNQKIEWKFETAEENGTQ